MKIAILRLLNGHWPPHCANGVLIATSASGVHDYEIYLDSRMFFWVKNIRRGTLSCYPVHTVDSWDPVAGESTPFDEVKTEEIKRGPGRPPREAA